MTNEDNWSSRWRLADYKLLGQLWSGNLTRANAMKASSRGAERDLVNVANEPYQPQVPHEAATRGPRANFTLTSHGRTTKKNTGSSTPMATLPM